MPEQPFDMSNMRDEIPGFNAPQPLANYGGLESAGWSGAYPQGGGGMPAASITSAMNTRTPAGWNTALTPGLYDVTSSGPPFAMAVRPDYTRPAPDPSNNDWDMHSSVGGGRGGSGGGGGGGGDSGSTW